MGPAGFRLDTPSNTAQVDSELCLDGGKLVGRDIQPPVVGGRQQGREMRICKILAFAQMRIWPNKFPNTYEFGQIRSLMFL